MSRQRNSAGRAPGGGGSVCDRDPLANVGRALQLVEQRHREVFGRDTTLAQPVGQKLVATRAVGAGPLPGLDHGGRTRSEEHTSELQSHSDLVCRLLLEKKKKKTD